MFDIFLEPQNWVALATLILLEIVLGIDNIVFVAIIGERVAPQRRNLVRRLGLAIAVVARILLLLTLSWVVKLKKPLFSLMNVDFSGKSLVLLSGGLFLLTKATLEIYRKTELLDRYEQKTYSPRVGTFLNALTQIVFLDLIFSIESIITAVGMVREIVLMVIAVLVAVSIMIVFVNIISEYISKHASLKLLALSFLMLIGVLLIAEGTGFHFPRGYVYFSMAFALFVQLLNIRYETKLKLATSKEAIAKERSAR
jgi:predicted tellurium resistance membrane protein TerC